MVRPVLLVDGSDSKSPIISAYSMRQCLSKDTGLAGGNINVDFTTADVTDADADGGTSIIETEQGYFASICRLAAAAPNIPIVVNLNIRTNAAFSTNPYKFFITDNMVLIPFHLNLNQDTVRFRFNNLAVTDNFRVSLWKIS